VCGDLLAGGSYDAVLGNLPYVPDGTELQPEIALYEPAQALFGGRDGLDLMRRLVAECEAPLLALEVGAGQADAVARLLIDAGFQLLERRRDLGGHERVLLARR
jgi:release factor glutamine methyltransferase